MEKEKKFFEEPKMKAIRLEAEGVLQGVSGSDPKPNDD